MLCLPGQRLWFIVDEIDALGAIDGLKDELPRLRKFGGRCVLGFPSLAQVSGTYGHADAQTILIGMIIDIKPLKRNATESAKASAATGLSARFYAKN